MPKAICPGTFDPVTNGHLDIIERAARVFEQVFVVVFRNPSKAPLFEVEERTAMLEEATAHLANVVVDSSDGLLVHYAHEVGAQVIVKGLRAVSDFEYEFQMALMNKKLDSGVETVFLATSSEHAYLSSNMVKMLAGFGACLEGLVPPGVEDRLRRRLAGATP
ncbi:MAG: pantetheine-phosphate adenylyltransferase [Bacillota bacterium]|nr:pantetheine-phosphate adenylyltransferase [Bacillota bacterium]